MTEILSGQRFNRLIVKDSFSGKTSEKIACVCDCGKETLVIVRNLKSGNTNSCGCYQKDRLADKASYINKRRSLAYGVAAFNQIYSHYSMMAKKRGYIFMLSKEEAKHLFAGDCFYCGAIPANIRISENGNFIYNGIDRKNNSLGYIAENCVPCCAQCNWAKRDMAFEDFISWIKKVSRFMSMKSLTNGNGNTTHIIKDPFSQIPAQTPKP